MKNGLFNLMIYGHPVLILTAYDFDPYSPQRTKGHEVLRGGNMTSRTEGGTTYTQVFDAENRLVSVTVGGQTTSFLYDGDGNMVEKINPDDSYVLYIGSVMEVEKDSNHSVQHTTVYYPAGGAVRVDGTLSYVLGDQLGSASLTLSSAGAVTGQTRYYPFGEMRVTTGTMPTDRLFTAQRAMADLGIYHYNARFYDLGLGRFLSADTMLPGAGNSQAYDRYAYVKNNPILYNDPTGHMFDCRGVFSSGSACVSGGDEGEGGGPPSNPMEELSADEGEDVGSDAAITYENPGNTPQDSVPRISQNRLRGIDGESQAGITKNTTHIDSSTETANYRIPD
jgi:RHS repeat-associated protein